MPGNNMLLVNSLELYTPLKLSGFDTQVSGLPLGTEFH